MRQVQDHFEYAQQFAPSPRDNMPGGRDLVGHSAVQAWSAGDLFPAVISKVEFYSDPLGFDDWAFINSQVSHGDVAPHLYAAYREVFYTQPLANRLAWEGWRLSYPGAGDILFGSYEQAASVARQFLAEEHQLDIALANKRAAQSWVRNVADALGVM